MKALPWVLALAVGLMIATQARINGQLAVALDSGVDAATVSFVLGFGCVIALLVATPSGRLGIRRLVSAVRERRLVPWQLIGGFLGAYFVWAQSMSVPRIGVALFIVAVVAGQTVNSLVVDRLGVAPIGVIAITRTRVVSALIGLGAVCVAVIPRLSGSPVVLWALLASVAAGAFVAFQQAVNGRVARAAGSSWAATGVNFALGAGTLVLVVLVLNVLGEPFHFSDLPASPWLYLGGPVGVAFIAAAAWVVPMLGVLRFGLLSIAGQLTGALVWDVLAPTPGAVVSINVVAGIVLAFLAVVVSAKK